MATISAGYSGTPLLKKLGIKDSMKVLLVNAPAEYATWLQADISKQFVTARSTPDLVHLFVTSAKEMVTQLQKLETARKANPNIAIWVSWYKKSAGMNTDVTEDVIRNYALQHDLVDIKVCAVSEQWSGLKLVVPKAKR
ncbi:MAG: hypothetical protein QM731_15070 [Chitinophagaceae bacterium]